jgi:hypothetical protein
LDTLAASPSVSALSCARSPSICSWRSFSLCYFRHVITNNVTEVLIQ